MIAFSWLDTASTCRVNTSVCFIVHPCADRSTPEGVFESLLAFRDALWFLEGIPGRRGAWWSAPSLPHALPWGKVEESAEKAINHQEWLRDHRHAWSAGWKHSYSWLWKRTDGGSDRGADSHRVFESLATLEEELGDNRYGWGIVGMVVYSIERAADRRRAFKVEMAGDTHQARVMIGPVPSILPQAETHRNMNREKQIAIDVHRIVDLPSHCYWY